MSRLLRIAVAVSTMVACSSGETPLAPAVQSRASVEMPPQANYSFSISPANRTVYLRLSRVRSDSGEPLSGLIGRMFASADSAAAIRLIVDLRSVQGGDAFLIVPLVKGVLAREQFVRRGGLVVVVGPNSFAPAQNAARVLEQHAHPIFIGAE